MGTLERDPLPPPPPPKPPPQPPQPPPPPPPPSPRDPEDPEEEGPPDRSGGGGDDDDPDSPPVEVRSCVNRLMSDFRETMGREPTEAEVDGIWSDCGIHRRRTK